MPEERCSMQTGEVWPTKVDASGRMMLPARARAELGIDRGDEVLLVRDEQGLHVMTPAQLASEVQEYFATLWPKDRDLAAELIRDRREEAAREARGD